MDKYTIDRDSMMILIKKIDKPGYKYQILPSGTYSGKTIFGVEKFFGSESGCFEYDIIILTKKIIKKQVDTIKNEFQSIRNVKYVVFEYGEIMDEDIDVEITENDIMINGSISGKTVNYVIDDSGLYEL